MTSLAASSRLHARHPAPGPASRNQGTGRARRDGHAPLARLAGVAAVAALAATSALAQIGFAQTSLAGVPVTLVYPTETRGTPRAFGAFEIEVAIDAPMAAAASGRRPLVVTSHGTGGSPLPDHGLAAALARAGFVVAQPLHAGDNYLDYAKAGPEAWQTRPAEVLRLLDALAADANWGPRLRLDRVGVHGTSAGGVTALSLAGAQWSTLALLEHCQAHLDEDIGFCLNGAPDAATQARRRAMFERVRGVPAAVLPQEITLPRGGRSPMSQVPAAVQATVRAAAPFDPRPDFRIAAVSLSVPVAAIFSTESLARVQVPVGLLAAQADQMLVPRFHSARVQAHCPSCTVLADLPGATHFDVMQPWPAAVGRVVGAQQVRGVATNPRFDARLREQAYARVVEFHRQHLGSPE